MRLRLICGTSAALISVLFVLPAAADEYDFELGLDYGNQQTDELFAQGVDINGPIPEAGTLARDTEADTYSLLGSWYYSGLRDIDGPRSRAAFLGRTSSLSVGYAFGEESVDWSYSGGSLPGVPPSPPAGGTYDVDTTTYGAQLRHVWADSGWYAVAGTSRVEHDQPGFEWGGNRWEGGVGKYLGHATALDLRIVNDEQAGLEETTYGLNFSHIGALPGSWQFGTDLGFEYSNDYDDYRVGLSLFPNHDLAFGLTYQDSERNGFSDEDIGGFASWFLRDDIELRARYTSHDVPSREWILEHDDASFDFGINVRF
jgi:hypothetical protein